MSTTINFTKRTLENLPPAQPGKRDVYHDRKTPGLELRVTASGVRTFALRRRVRGGPPERVTLGRFPDMTVEQARKAAASPWVFPSASSASRHIEEPKKYLTRVAGAGAVKVSIHDLRRTFITVAERMDVSHYALKHLLNHKTGADVTAGYIIVDVERLRDPMQRITDFILRAAGAKPSAAVVSIRPTEAVEATS